MLLFTYLFTAGVQLSVPGQEVKVIDIPQEQNDKNKDPKKEKSLIDENKSKNPIERLELALSIEPDAKKEGKDIDNERFKAFKTILAEIELGKTRLPALDRDVLVNRFPVLIDKVGEKVAAADELKQEAIKLQERLIGIFRKTIAQAIQEGKIFDEKTTLLFPAGFRNIFFNQNSRDKSHWKSLPKDLACFKQGIYYTKPDSYKKLMDDLFYGTILKEVKFDNQLHNLLKTFHFWKIYFATQPMFQIGSSAFMITLFMFIQFLIVDPLRLLDWMLPGFD